MHPMWLCICSVRAFEGTFKNALWRKTLQMQSMQLCICSGRWFEESFENTLWRKIPQVQAMWLCICSGKSFKETFENSLLGKNSQMYPMRLCICSVRQFEGTFENSLWRKIPQMQVIQAIQVISGDIQKDIPKKSTKQMQTIRLLVRFIGLRSKFGDNSGPEWTHKHEAALALLNCWDVPPYYFKTGRFILNLMFSICRLCYFPQVRL